MKPFDWRSTTPRAVGVACAATATGLGLAYMAAAGAPTGYLAVNALSLVMGLALLAALPRRSLGTGATVVLLGGLLLATALFGVSVDGATRWMRVGGISLQISLIALPVMLVAFARAPGGLAAIGTILGAFALAIQPDRAMAGVMAAALAVLVLYRRERPVAVALAAAVVSFGVTMARPDSLPAVPFVDQILHTSFQVHPLAGMAVVGGALLLGVPALVGVRHDPANRHVHAVFGTVWLGAVVAAALGNYPTPLVGYGGSAILGYAIALACMPSRARSAADVTAPAAGAARGESDPSIALRIGLAR